MNLMRSLGGLFWNRWLLRILITLIKKECCIALGYLYRVHTISCFCPQELLSLSLVTMHSLFNINNSARYSTLQNREKMHILLQKMPHKS